MKAKVKAKTKAKSTMEINYSVATIKKIKQHEWSVEELEDVRRREELGQNRKGFLSFLTSKIKKIGKK